MVYTGRFAPTPSGPLHFGSVVTALGSFLDARAQSGRWLLRIDDLDPPRVQPGAADAILATLEALGLVWDGPIVYQSARRPAYAAALAELVRRDLIFGCRCSRRDLGHGPYPGTCARLPPRRGTAWRVRVDAAVMEIEDGVQGRHRECLAQTCGDFVVQRADGVTAYHLAVVVDDAWAGVDAVIRGADLLDSTPRQVHLQRLLGLPEPRYAHLPVAVDAAGLKLGKQTHAPGVAPCDAREALFHAMRALGLAPPAEARQVAPDELLRWALPRWSLAAIDPSPRVHAWPPEAC